MRIASNISCIAVLLAPRLPAQTPKSSYYCWFTLSSETIVDVVPSYAACWFDKKREIHASLVNLSDSSRLRALLDSLEPIGFAGDPRWRPKKIIIIEKARYTYTQLDDWRRKIARKAVGAKDFGGVGIRPNENRIRVVVLKGETIEKVRRIVKSLGIPDDAVVIVILRGRVA